MRLLSLLVVFCLMVGCGDAGSGSSAPDAPERSTAPTSSAVEGAEEESATSEPDEPVLKPGEGILTAEWVGVEAGDFGQKVMSFKIRNVGDRDIDSVVAGVHFYDQFGDRMGTFGMKIEHDDPLPAGDSYVQSGSWIGVQDRAIELAETGRATMQARVQKIVYADGEALKFD